MLLAAALGAIGIGGKEEIMAWKYKYLHTLTGTNETVVISDDGEKLEKNGLSQHI